MRVVVVGGRRMGQTGGDAVAGEPELGTGGGGGSRQLEAAVHGIIIASELQLLAYAKVDVVVDFTVAAAARITLPWLAMHNIQTVVGTTGFTTTTWRRFDRHGDSNCLIAANFAIGLC